MILTLLMIPLGFFFIQFSSYLVHRWMHRRNQPEHERHHFVLYPPKKFLTKEYKDPGFRAGLFQAVAYTTPVIPAAVLVWYLAGLWPLVAFTATCVVIGKIDQYVHDAIHIERHWLEQYEWFWQRRFLHKNHHEHVHHNFGICWFVVDKSMGSFMPVENRWKA